MSDEIEYVHINMDNGSRTTKDGLLKYAADFRGGMWRAIPPEFGVGVVVMAYGTRSYSEEDALRLASQA